MLIARPVEVPSALSMLAIMVVMRLFDAAVPVMKALKADCMAVSSVLCAVETWAAVSLPVNTFSKIENAVCIALPSVLAARVKGGDPPPPACGRPG